MTISALIQILAAEFAKGALFEITAELQYELSMLIAMLLIMSIGLLPVILTQIISDKIYLAEVSNS